MNIVLLDRDGVINRDRADYVKSIEELEILPNALEALRLLHTANIRTLLITNQACVGKGILSVNGLQEIHDHLRTVVAQAGGRIEAIYYCPHTNEAGCGCRKPLPGLIQQAQHDWGFVPEATWMVGDAVRDIQAASAAGCQAALVRTGKGKESEKLLPETPVYDSLLAFVYSYCLEI